jgi:CrcB protein
VLPSILAIALGAALGAVLRWALSVQLNGLFPALPAGTLVANLLGGYLIGVAMAYFAAHPDLPPAWRLFIVTGFLGGLTTFSTFSAEVVTQLTEGRLGWALATIATHVAGSVGMTLLGIATVAWWRATR